MLSRYIVLAAGISCCWERVGVRWLDDEPPDNPPGQGEYCRETAGYGAYETKPWRDAEHFHPSLALFLRYPRHRGVCRCGHLAKESSDVTGRSFVFQVSQHDTLPTARHVAAMAKRHRRIDGDLAVHAGAVAAGRGPRRCALRLWGI